MAVASPILPRDVIGSQSDALPADGKGGSRGGPVMRTTNAASPRRLHWQAAFTTKPYKAQTSSLVVWQHVFVSDTPMTNWCGSSLLLILGCQKTPIFIGASTKHLAAAEPRRIARST